MLKKNHHKLKVRNLRNEVMTLRGKNHKQKNKNSLRNEEQTRRNIRVKNQKRQF